MLVLSCKTRLVLIRYLFQILTVLENETLVSKYIELCRVNLESLVHGTDRGSASGRGQKLFKLFKKWVFSYLKTFLKIKFIWLFLYVVLI